MKSNSLALKNPKIANEWHPVKNGDLTPNDIAASSNIKVWWKCPVADDHEWFVSPNQRTRKGMRKCPYCSGNKVSLSNCLATNYPKFAKQWHPIKNEILTPYEIVWGSHKKVWWKCSIADDHEWQATANSRTNQGGNCPYCVGQKVSISNCLEVIFPEIAKEWHLSKNNLTPRQITGASDRKVWWKCLQGHEWKSSVKNRTKLGNGCPICSESKGERAIVEFLAKGNFIFERQCRFDNCRDKNPLAFDFVIYSHNNMKLIEYQGIQHYEPVGFGGDASLNYQRVVRHDKIKRIWCEENEVELLEIPYWELGKIDTILVNFL